MQSKAFKLVAVAPNGTELGNKVYAVSITIRIVLGFMLLTLIWNFDFPPFIVLIIAVLNDGTIMTISKDRVKPSPMPDSWKLSEIFVTGIILGSYLAMMTVIFFWAAYKTDFFPRVFGVSTLEKTAHDDFRKLASAIYLQVSIISQALIFVTRSRSWSYVERPGLLLVVAFVIAQLIATVIAVYANWRFAAIEGIGWGWAGVIWLCNIIFYIPLDFIKFFMRYTSSGRAWDLVIEQGLLSQGKRTLGRNNGNFSGHMHREPCMGCNHQTQRCSLSILISQNSIRWLKKQKGELKLQG